MTYFLSRLPSAFATLLLVATLCFALVKLAGEEAAFGERNPSESVRREVLKTWGLDKPLYVQYWMHLRKLLVMDSLPSRQQKNKTLRDVLSAHFPSSLRIGVRAMILALACGIPIGVACAVYHNRAVDMGGTVLALVGVSVPSFVLATTSVYFLSRQWGYIPAIGWEEPFSRLDPGTSPWLRVPVEELLRFRAWVPAACLAAFPFAAVLRLTRSSMLEALRQDYVRTARAKGLAEWKVVGLHAMRNAMTPVVSYIGPIAAGVLTGSLVVEKVFAIPGIGAYFVESVSNRDMPIIMGMTVFYATLLVLGNLFVDAIYPILNPRLKA